MALVRVSDENHIYTVDTLNPESRSVSDHARLTTGWMGSSMVHLGIAAKAIILGYERTMRITTR